MSAIANAAPSTLSAAKRRKHRPKKRRRRLGEREAPPKHGPKLRIEGFTAAELGARVGVGARTVRFYLEERLLPPAVFRGRATRYVHEHLVRLAAVRQLQREKRQGMLALRRRLAALSEGAIEQLAEAFLREREPAAADSVVAAEPAPPAPATAVAARWQRLTLLPGLELHLSGEASPDTLRKANEIALPFVEPAAAIGAR